MIDAAARVVSYWCPPTTPRARSCGLGSRGMNATVAVINLCLLCRCADRPRCALHRRPAEVGTLVDAERLERTCPIKQTIVDVVDVTVQVAVDGKRHAHAGGKTLQGGLAVHGPSETLVRDEDVRPRIEKVEIVARENA